MGWRDQACLGERVVSDGLLHGHGNTVRCSVPKKGTSHLCFTLHHIKRVQISPVKGVHPISPVLLIRLRVLCGKGKPIRVYSLTCNCLSAASRDTATVTYGKPPLIGQSKPVDNAHLVAFWEAWAGTRQPFK